MNRLIILITAFLMIFTAHLLPQQSPFALVEEDKNFWNRILTDNTISNKNMLYAGYVAYKEKLNDLSMDTLKEYININSSNSTVITIANYYMAKNLYSIGNYSEAVQEFNSVSQNNNFKNNDIRFAAMINAAIVYYKLNNIEKFRESLQKVISEDIEGRYKKIALDILSNQ